MTRSSRHRRRLATEFPVEPGSQAVFRGGCYRPLSEKACERIIECAFDILDRIGIAGAPAWLIEQLCRKGARQREDGRLTFSRQLVEQALHHASHKVSLPGFEQNLGLEIGAGNVHIGTGGAAVQVLDANSGAYRDSTLSDLYNMMRTLDHCEHVHYGVRPLVARDMPTPLDLDINTAYACLRATAKPIGVSFDNAAHVEPVGVGEPGPLGLVHTLGNVAEWTETPFVRLTPDLPTPMMEARILKGGGWALPRTKWDLSTVESELVDVSRVNTIGFRCAKSATRPE